MYSAVFNKNRRGFTLIELLVVIAIIVTLAVLVSVAIDPVRRFQESRNARRWSDVNSINTAIHTYILDNGGALPSGMAADDNTYQLGTCTADGNAICSGAEAACLDLTTSLANYLKSIPLDPLNGSTTSTGYSVVVDANNITTVKACSAERGATIQISQ
jgi:prepilin-type N-terminal cleavage/methylation domain-containing protein